jgi:hypothetical protein
MEIDGIRIKIVKASREDYVGDAAHRPTIMDMKTPTPLSSFLACRKARDGRQKRSRPDVAEVMKRPGAVIPGGIRHRKGAPLEVVWKMKLSHGKTR